MPGVVVIAHLTAKPGKEDELQQVLTDLVAAVHPEPGCDGYALHHAAEDPASFAFVEQWASPDALQTHMGAPALQEAFAKAGELLAAPPSITSFAPVPAGDPAKGTLAG